MPTKRQLFLQHVAQTNEMPLMLNVSKAKGMYIYDDQDQAYLDLNSGISVSSLGHCHPNVVKAVQKQVEKHMHTMVYGEHLQQPQIAYAKLLTSQLPKNLEKVYYLMAGTEAVELAMKLIRVKTQRTEIFSMRDAYHGSTYGSEALRSDQDFTSNFAPGVPDVRHIRFNVEADLEKITTKTAGVIVEPVQAESGINPPKDNYLKLLAERCKEVGALLVFDEIQTGFGRTGSLFAFMKYGVTPDMLLLGKSMGGGMPISAVVSSAEIFMSIIKNPALGHITTFGGHPVSCAAALAALETLLDGNMIEEVDEKNAYFIKNLNHPIIKEIRSAGLMMGVELTHRKYLKHVISNMYDQRALADFFLFNDKSFRLAPPLIIDKKTMDKSIKIILKAMDYAHNKYAK